MALWRRLRTPQDALLLACIALSLIRSRDQPGIDVGLGGTTAHVVPGDVALAALLVVSLFSLRPIARPARVALGGGLAFLALVVVTGATNGAGAFVASVKLAELAVIALG